MTAGPALLNISVLICSDTVEYKAEICAFHSATITLTITLTNPNTHIYILEHFNMRTELCFGLPEDIML